MSVKMPEKQSLSYIDFLDSDTISLQADQSDSGRSFKIHRKLLSSKCKTIISAFERGFKEEREGVYIFTDTSEGTLARFIEWAYTGDYPAVINRTESVETKKPEQIEANNNNNNTVTTAQMDLPTSKNHTLLAHIHLYVFCSIYLIPDLQDLAASNAVTCYMEMVWFEPNSLDTQLFVSALRVSFSNLRLDDPLLNWLVQDAALSINELRMQASFHDLLRDFPILGSRIVSAMADQSTETELPALPS